MEKISIEIPAKSEYVSVIRLTISSVLNTWGYDIEDIEDFKVSISEAINEMIECNDFIQIEVLPSQESVEIFIKSEYICPENNSMCNLILKSLMDEVKINKNSIFIKKFKASR